MAWAWYWMVRKLHHSTVTSWDMIPAP